MHASRDIFAGGALVVLGIAMILGTAEFPSIGAVSYGPDFYPKIVATGLILSGLGISAEGLAKHHVDIESGPLHLPRTIALVVIIAAFALGFRWLGFHVAATLALIAAMRLFGSSWLLAIPYAVGATVVLHVLFYTVLRVPLPWGLLLPIAW